MALSSQSGRPGRRCPPGPAPGLKPPGRLGAVAGDGGVAAGRVTGGVAFGPSPLGVTGVPSGRLGGGAPGRPEGFWSCMSSPGATGLRMPGGMAGRLPPDAGRAPPGGRPPSPLLPPLSRRIGLPTSSRVFPPGRDGRPAPVPGRVGAPGRWVPAGRWGIFLWLPGALGRGLTAGLGEPGPAFCRAGGPSGRLGCGRPTNSGLAAGRCGGGAFLLTGVLGWGRLEGAFAGRGASLGELLRTGAAPRGFGAGAEGCWGTGRAGGDGGRLTVRSGAGAGAGFGLGTGCCAAGCWRTTGF